MFCLTVAGSPRAARHAKKWPTRLVVAIAVLASGCGHNQPRIEIAPVPARQTSGALAGPLCSGDRCACRSGGEDGGAGYPEASAKRFEVRLSSPYEVWATLPGRILYKGPEQAEACFYVDLAPGQHKLGFRASHRDGVGARISVHELGQATASWYDTFRFECGFPGVCSFDELAARKQEYAAIPRGLHDPCGSTKIKGLTWGHGRAPDVGNSSDVALELVLDVYKFAPTRPHGDTSCKP